MEAQYMPAFPEIGSQPLNFVASYGGSFSVALLIVGLALLGEGLFLLLRQKEKRNVKKGIILTVASAVIAIMGALLWMMSKTLQNI